MLATAFNFGNPVYWNKEKFKWFYTKDDSENTDETYQTLICPRCKMSPTEEGHDPCIKNLANVEYACCGHGITTRLEQAYIKFNDGKVVRFKTTEEILDYVNVNKKLFKDEN